MDSNPALQSVCRWYCRRRPLAESSRWRPQHQAIPDSQQRIECTITHSPYDSSRNAVLVPSILSWAFNSFAVFNPWTVLEVLDVIFSGVTRHCIAQYKCPNLEVPARLPPPCRGTIHDVIGDEEECLQELHTPAEDIGKSQFLGGMLWPEEP